ncbi:PREDICTED: protein FAM166B-like [Nicrophorus vespilloides]|uniref:Protein FAM166B-like n=1 Tax=Nicrophorus vespilloides TaxID=110193 RepID=A0ABM1MYY5_NICVS|nr:PREDICTED: protein FAM166B-like [Nicrophorus vespilloides]
MFVPLTERERQQFFAQNSNSFIPGYTGHCPTLRFQYGTSYGAKTKEILQEMKNHQHENGGPCFGSTVFEPTIRKERAQMENLSPPYKTKPYRYIIGYTGFIPTLSFRYGESYGKAADESMNEFEKKQTKYRDEHHDFDRMRAQSAPKLTSIRHKDEVDRILKHSQENKKFIDRKVSPEFPPIAGYTGYIPKVKGNEESLSQRYNTVVKRGLTLLKQERDGRQYINKAKNKVRDIVDNYK